jgi:hypothetical protein
VDHGRCIFSVPPVANATGDGIKSARRKMDDSVGGFHCIISEKVFVGLMRLPQVFHNACFYYARCLALR